MHVAVGAALGILLLLVSGSALASCGDTSCVATIKQIVVYPDEQQSYLVELNITDADKAFLTCTLNSGHYFTVLSSAFHLREIYAGLLAAQARGTEVTLRYKEESSNCEILYMRVW